MSEAVERLKSQLAALPAQERANLADFLFLTLDQEPDLSPEDWKASWDVELARRWTEIESGKVVGVPVEQVFARLREKYKGRQP